MPAIADPRRSSPTCAQDAMRVSRGRVIELVYLAGPARARIEKREKRARPIVAMPRGFAIHQRHVNAFRCWFAAGVITLFIKFHHPRASAARLPARASLATCPGANHENVRNCGLPWSAVWFAVISDTRYNPALRWCTQFIVYLRVAWLSITVSRSGHTRLPQIMMRYQAVNTKLRKCGDSLLRSFFMMPIKYQRGAFAGRIKRACLCCIIIKIFQ